MISPQVLRHIMPIGLSLTILLLVSDKHIFAHLMDIYPSIVYIQPNTYFKAKLWDSDGHFSCSCKCLSLNLGGLSQTRVTCHSCVNTIVLVGPLNCKISKVLHVIERRELKYRVRISVN